MAEDINPRKISDDQQKQIEKERQTLMKQGMGQDHARREATEMVGQQPNSGGTNSAGDAPKGVHHQGNSRTGSQSNESK